MAVGMGLPRVHAWLDRLWTDRYAWEPADDPDPSVMVKLMDRVPPGAFLLKAEQRLKGSYFFRTLYTVFVSEAACDLFLAAAKRLEAACKFTVVRPVDMEDSSCSI